MWFEKVKKEVISIGRKYIFLGANADPLDICSPIMNVEAIREDSFHPYTSLGTPVKCQNQPNQGRVHGAVLPYRPI